METAQLHMERMIPELRDLEQKKIFTKPEISAIVEKRKYYEALIARPRSPDCFLKYIDYEKSLERLRRLRLGKSASHTRQGKGRITLSDYSIPLHILSLYATAAMRFPESDNLWLSYINYSLTQSSTKLVNRVLSAAIAAHPLQSRFWIMAAQFEADGDETGKGGGNVDGARKLLMRALRVVRETASIPVWLEWIRIELNFVQMIQTRKELLGIGDSEEKSMEDVHNRSQVNSHESELDPAVKTSLDLKQLHEEDLNQGGLVQGMDSVGLMGQKALLSGAIVKVVLSNAFKAVSDLEIFESVISLISSYDSSIKSSLLDFTYLHLSQLVPSSPRATILLKTRKLSYCSKPGKGFAKADEELIDSLAETIGELEQVCRGNEVDPPAMWKEFVKFLVDVDRKLTEIELRAYVVAVVEKTLNTLVKTSLDSPDVYALVIPHFRETKSFAKSVFWARTATTRFEYDLRLWIASLDVMVDGLQEGLVEEQAVIEAFEKARRRFPCSVRVAALEVQALRLRFSRGFLDANQLQLTLECGLDHSLNAGATAAEEVLGRVKSGYPALSAVEVYQRALVSPEIVKQKEAGAGEVLAKKINFLSERSVLSLNFLRWFLDQNEHDEQTKSARQSFDPKRSVLMRRLHTSIISARDNEFEDWIRFLKFLLHENEKEEDHTRRMKNYEQGNELIQRSEREKGQRFKVRLEEFWIREVDRLEK